jgi:hypothetical protein
MRLFEKEEEKSVTEKLEDAVNIRILNMIFACLEKDDLATAITLSEIYKNIW